MPRAEVGSIKWLSNKMKSKGLQRLRWYCQMCEKQCRDENGFKCHMISESHARQMQVFSQRPGRFMDDFSRSFEADFMRFMRTKYCRTRVLANTVYCEVISNKTHIHMNSTVWVTLSEFVRYLDRSGKCEVEETPRGFYLTYIDPDKIARESMAAANMKAEAAAEHLTEHRLKKAVEAAQKQAASVKQIPVGEFQRKEESLKISIGYNSINSQPLKRGGAHLFGNYDETDLAAKLTKKPNTMLDKLVPATPKTAPWLPKHPLEDSDDWVSNDLVVKWKGKKGIVMKCRGGVVRLQLYPLNENIIIPDVNPRDLETVIPKSSGKWVRVVLGSYRGHEGRLLSLDTNNERVSVLIFYGPYWGDPACDWPLRETHAAVLQRGELRADHAAVLQRGELRADDLPMDAVCRVGPPTAFQELDEVFKSSD